MRSLAVAAAVLLASSAHAKHVTIKSKTYDIARANVSLKLFEKWVAGDDAKFRNSGRVILLVHGAVWSGRCTFDPVPNYSMMDALAEAGYDVWTVDLHGYGDSAKPNSDWSDAGSDVADVDAAVDHIRTTRSVARVHVLGYQWGSQVAGLFAMQHPDKIGRLVLFGMRYRATERVAQPTQIMRANTMANALITPDEADIDADAAQKRAAFCLQHDAQSPNGSIFDLIRASNVNPAAVVAPTLMIDGDRNATPDLTADQMEFYKRLAAKDRWFIVEPGVGKYAPIEKNRARFVRTVVDFLEVGQQ